MSNVENLSPQTIRQVVKEMTDLFTNSPEGIKVQINEVDVTDIQALLEGPGNFSGDFYNFMPRLEREDGTELDTGGSCVCSFYERNCNNSCDNISTVVVISHQSSVIRHQSSLSCLVPDLGFQTFFELRECKTKDRT